MRDGVFILDERIAWEIPPKVLPMYLKGAYLLPEGWKLAWKCDLRCWEGHPDGYLTSPAHKKAMGRAK